MLKKLWKKIAKSPINFFSDLFIVAMVTLWIVDILWESSIATVVTVSSIILSFKTGMQSYDTSMWANIGNNVAIPLSTGGALWMIKNAVLHGVKAAKNKKVDIDFPPVNAEGEEDIFKEESEDGYEEENSTENHID